MIFLPTFGPTWRPGPKDLAPLLSAGRRRQKTCFSHFLGVGVKMTGMVKNSGPQFRAERDSLQLKSDAILHTQQKMSEMQPCQSDDFGKWHKSQNYCKVNEKILYWRW